MFHDRGDVRIEEVPDPVPEPDELLLEVHAAGICGTDGHEYAHGPAMFPIHARDAVTGHVGPMIPGHEVAGRVVAIGTQVDGYREGELVVSGAGISCGTCVLCSRGRTNLCARYTTVGLQRHGGLAQYCRVPAASCRSATPYGLPEDTAALGQPMAIGTHAMRRGGLRANHRAVIVGAGGIGMFIMYAAVAEGAHVTVLDIDEQRLELAARLGAHEVAVPDPEVPVRQQLGATDGDPDVVYEVSGTPGGLATAFDLVPTGGRLVAVGVQAGAMEVPLRDVTLREFEVIGTNAHVCGTDLPHALGLLAGREAPWSDVAPVALALDDLVPEGLEPLASGRSERIKTLVDPWTAQTRPTRMEITHG
jgi:(R,R)-butanediol dehydrogenase/meso-butanediol dehydrogenase/diacetyl reductase